MEGADLNRRRQPFQGCQINHLQTMFYENTRLMRERFGLHLDARGVLDSTRTPHTSHNFTSSLAVSLLLRARSKSLFLCSLTNVKTTSISLYYMVTIRTGIPDPA